VKSSLREGTDKFVSLLQASDGEKSDQDLVVDDASEVTIEDLHGIYSISYLNMAENGNSE
jgi:hypothetical protein